MKNFKITVMLLATAGILFISCKKETTQNTDENSAKDTKAIAKSETTTFNIEGMTCAMGCAKTIETKVASMEGVQKATVDFDNKTATIQYDAAVQSPEKIVELVESVADGKTYKVSNVKSTADKAMLYQDQDQDKKKKKSKKTAEEASTTTATPAAKTAETKDEKKGGCCAGKKACSKPATI
jgi:periplasmic mercuric ion binding protein